MKFDYLHFLIGIAAVVYALRLFSEERVRRATVNWPIWVGGFPMSAISRRSLIISLGVLGLWDVTRSLFSIPPHASNALTSWFFILFPLFFLSVYLFDRWKFKALARTNRKLVSPDIAGLASAIFFGIFLAVAFTMIWFVTPAIRDLPVGDDSPTAIGAPLGFILGCCLARRILSVPWIRRLSLAIGICATVIASVQLVSHFTMGTSREFDGLYHLFARLVWGIILIGATGLLISAFFAGLSDWFSANDQDDSKESGA